MIPHEGPTDKNRYLMMGFISFNLHYLQPVFSPICLRLYKWLLRNCSGPLLLDGLAAILVERKI